MIDPLDFSPWDFWTKADADARSRQQSHLSALGSREHHELASDAFVSELASVDNDRLLLGNRSYVAAGAYLTGDLEAGSDCSINAYTVVRGRVRLGNGVRIGAHTSILGFNHTMDDPSRPVFQQPLDSRGIALGDDVWVGSHVVILDGVTVGDHTVLAAGAVVTKDVPDGAIVGGNPARFLKWRIPPAETTADPASATAEQDDRAHRLAAFAATARAQAPAILERSWSPENGMFLDHPMSAPTVRAQTDAVELTDLLLGTAPSQLSAEELVHSLRAQQDPTSGLVPPLGPAGKAIGVDSDDPDAAYHVLAVGYALDLLGSSFAHPISIITDSSAEALTAFLDNLPWSDRAWNAGHWTDAIGTALLWTIQGGNHVPEGFREALIGWLTMHANPRTGMWGEPSPGTGLLEIVNGFYRASRGTFAQFGVPVPHPELVIDTVLLHVSDPRFFDPENHDACNVLDVAHPLWLTRATGYRSAEVTELAGRLIDSVVPRWVDNEGFSFRASDPPGSSPTAPGLQGTEMWLATLWYLADICGHASALGYRPRGVHRPEPAGTLT